MPSIVNFPAILRSHLTVPHNPTCTMRAGLYIQVVWAVPRSLATTWGIAVAFFSKGYLDGSVRPVYFTQAMCSPGKRCSMTCIRFPHSEIPGSKVVCTSPRLIAAYHVLHRLLVPRHPPGALYSLTEKSHLVGSGGDTLQPKF